MDLLDPFWNAGALNHPDEPWASCNSTKEGIVAFRSQRSCEEELRCLGRECRQLMLWGIDYQSRVVRAKPNAAEGKTLLHLTFDIIALDTIDTFFVQATIDRLNGSLCIVDSPNVHVGSGSDGTTL